MLESTVWGWMRLDRRRGNGVFRWQPSTEFNTPCNRFRKHISANSNHRLPVLAAKYSYRNFFLFNQKDVNLQQTFEHTKEEITPGKKKKGTSWIFIN